MSHFDAIHQAERDAQAIRRGYRDDPPACPACLRMMTRAEAAEKGLCTPCFETLSPGEPPIA